MKTGILTFHRAHNYGAVLQCYALQEILRGRGHEVVVIDYRQPWIEEFYKVFSMRMLRRNSGVAEAFAYLKKNLKKFLLAPLRGYHFSVFRESFLKLSDPCADTMPQDIDCYVIGSDQLWSLHCLGGSPDRMYLGDFTRHEGSRVIGYAVSADIQSVEAMADEICKASARFSELSMREAKIARRVNEISGRECDVCVDPTLLTDEGMWDAVVDSRWKDRNYVLVYEVRRQKKTKGLLRRKAEELAAKIGDGCSVIDLSDVRYSVQDFVSLFKYARYVVTTSFHGTVFSLLFQTPFYVLPLYDGYDLRYMELLHFIGAEDRIAGPEDELQPLPVDFTPLLARLEEKRRSSFDFLDRALKP